MSGMSMRIGGFGGVGGNQVPTYGTAMSYSPMVTPSSAAFGKAFTPTYPDTWDVVKPNDGFGSAFTVGVVSLVALVALRYVLPNK